jgi:hypothetical protein
LRDEKGWQKVDDLELLYFLDNSKPGLNAAVFFGDRKYLHATQAEIIDALLKAIESNNIKVPPNYPYRHVIYDGGLKKDAMRILHKLRALEAFKKILFMPLGDDIDSWNQRDFALDSIIELAGTEAVTFLDSVQRNEKHPKNTRIAASRGILRIAEKDKDNKTAWKGVEYAKIHSPSPIVQAQAKHLLEGTEDPVRKLAAQLVQAQPKVMTPGEMEEFFVEQMSAYRPINVTNDEGISTKRLFREPEAYEGKVVIFFPVRMSRSSFVSTPYAVFIDPEADKTFNAYGVNQTSQVIKFGETFLLIGAWQKAPRPDDVERRMGMHVYKICGMVTDQKAKMGEVLCETLKTPFSQGRADTQTSSAQNEFGGQTIQSPPSTVYEQQLQYYDTSGRLRRKETVYSKQYAELDGLAKQIVDYGIDPGSRVVVNYFSASAAQSNGYDKVVTEFRVDKEIRREEFMVDVISQRTGLSKKTFHYDQSGKIVQVENLVTQASAQSKGYDRIVFHYEHESAPKQASRVERRYIQSPANKTALVKLVMFYDAEGSMTKDEQYFTAPFSASQGARLVVSHYGRNRITTMQEHYFPDEFAKRNGYDLVKLYFDEKEAIVRTREYRVSCVEQAIR